MCKKMTLTILNNGLPDNHPNADDRKVYYGADGVAVFVNKSGTDQRGDVGVWKIGREQQEILGIVVDASNANIAGLDDVVAQFSLGSGVDEIVCALKEKCKEYGGRINNG